MMPKADVTSIKGLSPVIAIGQIRSMHNPRSTVGTMTEISNYLRLLYATVGVSHCPYCSNDIPTKTKNHMIEKVEKLPEGTVVEIRVPIHKIYGEEYNATFGELRKKGYRKIRIDGELTDISENIELDDFKSYRLEAIVDKITVKEGIYSQLKKSVENAIVLGSGFIHYEIVELKEENFDAESFYEKFCCSKHHIVMVELKQNNFSPNLLENSCRTCNGLGVRIQAEKQLFIAAPEKTIRQGAIHNFSIGGHMVISLTKRYNIDIDIPFKNLPEHIKNIIFFGNKGEKFPYWRKNKKRELVETKWRTSFEGIVHSIERIYRTKMRKGDRLVPGTAEFEFYHGFMTERTCSECQGKKINS
ncbi:unnamed protein product, partial [marine sediment metagenome]